jgi:hypothetical protein
VAVRSRTDKEGRAKISIIGPAPVDTGSLSEGSLKQQPGSSIYNKPMAPGDAEAALNGHS